MPGAPPLILATAAGSSDAPPSPRVVTKSKRTKGRKKNMADLAASLANRIAPKHKRHIPDMARNKWSKS